MFGFLQDLFTKYIPLRNQILKAFRVTLAGEVQKEGTVWPGGGGARWSGQDATGEHGRAER